MTLLQQIIDAGPHPTTLTFFVAPETAIGATDCLERINLKYDFDATQDLGESVTLAWPGMVWYRALHVQDYPYPIVVWAGEGPLEPDARPVTWNAAEALWSEPERAAIDGAERHLHVETLLHPDNVQLAYGFLMKIGALLAGERFLACYDRQSFRLRRAEEVYDLTASEAPPSIRELFATYAYRATPARSASEAADASRGLSRPEQALSAMGEASGREASTGRLSLVTFGLLRCVRPELLFLEIDARSFPMACLLIEALAGLLVAEGVPEPLAAFSLSDSPPLLTTIPRHRLGVAAAEVGPAEFTIAVFPAEPVEEFRDDPRRMHDGDFARLADLLLMTMQRLGVDHITPYETRIREIQARERLMEFARLWRDDISADLDFIYKVGVVLSAPNAESEPEDSEVAPGGDAQPARQRREHLWFRLSDLQDDSLRGELLSEPFEAIEMNVGEIFWHQAADVTDWAIRLPGGATLGPNKLAELRALARRAE